ncbi:hypothetical protein LSH36_19g00001 [Paralvinella palmiformis]|uniref:Uncharacterized protein n=1 Tax=Paralvinella palmiformis TaxID=53620 RepID=A0AAD9KAN1_9ANNE|nr:hypothetical protein LSH36_19g00001 [Paralvinella palmiformis]
MAPVPNPIIFGTGPPHVVCLEIQFECCVNRTGINVHGLRYESLVPHEMNITKKMLHLRPLPDYLVEKAKDAFKKDSQANTPSSPEKVRYVWPNPPTPPAGFLDVAHAISVDFGVPGPDVYRDKAFRLPNSLEV